MMILGSAPTSIIIIIMAMRMVMMMGVGAKPATNSEETAVTDGDVNNCGNISVTLDKKL